jgi:putative PEP-CTERM system histidine kinase
MLNTSLVLYSTGAIAYLVLAWVLVRGWRANVYSPTLAAAALVSVLWQAGLALNTVAALPGVLLELLEILHAGAWMTGCAVTLKRLVGATPPKRVMAPTFGLLLGVPLLLALAAPLLLGPYVADVFQAKRAWCGLLLAIGILIMVEQLYRNTSSLPVPAIRFLCIGLAASAVYDMYLFADTLIFERVNLDLWRARGGLNTIAALFIAISIRRARQRPVIALSREVAYYTTSLTAAGLFLFSISLVGYFIRDAGTWGTVLQLMLLFSAALAVATVFVSRKARDWLRVTVSKNFFAYKYDYRDEWLRLIDQLSRPDSREDLYVRAIQALADLYKCPGGVLWLKEENRYVPTAPCRMALPRKADEPADSDFIHQLEQEWIYEIARPRDAKEVPPPAWVANVPRLGLIVPLLSEHELIGFVGLQESLVGDAHVDWEDLDIIKTSARMVASYLVRHRVGEQLARTRQFDTYHQLTAFIMHDLKNLIAQQELVVKNAAKHKENPAFVEDAIETIQNSVTRMSNLLNKLRHSEPSEKKSLPLRDILIDAINRSNHLRPIPSLRVQDGTLAVFSDRDHLAMVISHVIKNAQEATAEDGFVDVTLSREDQHAVILVEDNGAGMDDDFVRDRLFKPFESTKTGKGMGIGVYQTREFIRSLGGTVHVESEPGVGTRFTLRVPLAPARGASAKLADSAA